MSTTLVAKKLKERAELFTATEEICFRLARGEFVGSDQFEILDALDWDKRAQAREGVRCKQIISHQERAGINGAFEKTKTELAKKEPAILEVIEQRAAQISELEAANRADENKLVSMRANIESMTEARRALCDDRVLPDATRNLVNRETSRMKNELAERIGALESRKLFIEGITAIPTPSTIESRVAAHDDSVRIILEHCERLPEDHACFPDRFNAQHSANGTTFDVRVRPATWDNYLRELLAELPSIESELGELQTEFDRRYEQIQSLRNVYLLS